MNYKNGYKLCFEIKFRHGSHLKAKLWLNFKTSAMPFATQGKETFLSECDQTRSVTLTQR